MTNEVAEKRSVDDELLDWGVDQRKAFIATMMPLGKLPEDPKDKALILKAIDGIDKTAVNRKRIKIEDKAATNNAETARIIAEVYGNVQSKNPYVIDQTMQEVPHREAPQIPAHFQDVATVEGEMETTPPQDSYETFMKRMNGGEG